MTTPLRTLALASALVFGLSASAAAQQVEAPAVRSNTAGFNLGIFLAGASIQVDGSDETEAGRGGSLHVGYGFNQLVSVFARANAASIASQGGGANYGMAHVDLGARLSFGSQSAALRPFVQGAVNGRAVADGDLEARGSGLTAGLGVEYFVNPALAVETGFSFSFGDFSEGRLGDGEWLDFGNEAFGATSARFDLGISWHP